MIKLLKQLFPFIFASFLLPQNKTKTNTKNKCKIQQLFSNVLIPTTTTTTPQHQQPTTNKLKKKLKLQTKKKPTNNLPPTITEHRSLATKTNHSTGIELKNCDEIKSNYAHANALLPHPNHRTTDTSNNRPTEPSYLQTTKPPIHRTTNPTNHHLRPSFTSDYNRNFHVKRRRNLRAVVANRNR